MARLVFNFQQLRPLIEHTLASRLRRLTFDERFKIYGEELCLKHQEGEEEKGEPGLWLVKDHGIYLMSNGEPGLKKDGTVATEEDAGKCYHHLAVYAKGYNPEKDDDIWEKTHRVSGDDFCDLVPVQEFDMSQPWTHLIINLSRRSLIIKLEQRETEKKQP